MTQSITEISMITKPSVKVKYKHITQLWGHSLHRHYGECHSAYIVGPLSNLKTDELRQETLTKGKASVQLTSSLR